MIKLLAWMQKKGFMTHLHQQNNYEAFWDIRFFSGSVTEIKKWIDIVSMVSSAIEEYFPRNLFTISYDPTPDFRLFPFDLPDDPEKNPILNLKNIGNDVYVKGDLLGFKLKGGKRLPDDDFVGLCYSEQIVAKLKIAWFECPDDDYHKKEALRCLDYVMSCLNMPNMTLLSIQTTNHENADSFNAFFNDYIASIPKEKGNNIPSQVKFPEPTTFSARFPKSIMSSPLISLQSMMERWDEKSVIMPYTPCIWGSLEGNELNVSDIIHVKDQKIAFCSKLLPTGLYPIDDVTLFVDESNAPIWHRSYTHIEGEKIVQWSRLILLPKIENGRDWLKAIKQYPASIWFTDDGLSSASMIAAHGSLPQSNLHGWASAGFALEKEIDEEGEVTFSAYLDDDIEGDVCFFKGNYIDTVELFGKMSTLDRTDIVDVDDARYLSSLIGGIPGDHDVEQDENCNTLQ